MNLANTIKLFVIFIFLSPTLILAQSITGKIVDQENKPLEFVTVAVINSKDSILISYDSTDKYGKFELTQISNGERLFQVHLVGYKTYQKTIKFKNEPINMGIIKLNNANELDEVVVNAVVPVIIKKDTVAYNAKAFKIRVDDTVEDLLKKLPGVEVDAAGKVTAQGEEVTKVYVGGKEFFSGDPTIATKNISADAIKTVEVIDEKSEKARVSGINDSEQKKVINLKLKDDKKVNDFGKAQAGYGTDDRYLTSLNYNRFSSKLQTSIIGKFNNVNTTGSDISEVMVFSSGGGGRAMRMGSSTPSSGFVTTGVGGLNLGYELKKKQNLNTDYFYNYTNTTSGDVITIRSEFIGDEEINSKSRSRSENTTNSHKLNFNYRDRSNKLSSLYIQGRVNRSKNEGNSINSLDKYNGQDELDLQSIGSSDSKSDNSSGNVGMYYTKRFNEKTKRNFSLNAGFDGSKSSSTSNNNQLNKFNISDPNSAFESKQEITRDQDLDNSTSALLLNYTEPLAKKHFLDFSGEIKYNTTNDDVNQEKYENDIIQNPLIYTQYYKNTDLLGGIFYKYDNDTLTISAGAIIANQTQKFGLENQDNYNNSYTNFNPEIKVMYRPKRGKFLRMQFYKSIKLPGLRQVTPVVNDFNPLFISQGNPELDPEDNYAASAMFGIHKFETGFSLFSRLSYNYVKNSIVNSEFTDQLGIRYTTYENLGDKNNFNLSVNFGNRLKSLGLRYRINLNAGYSEYMSIINLENNETQSKDGTFGLSLENNKKEKIDASIGASWKKNYTTFTTGNNTDRDYLQQSYYTKIDWNVTDKFNVNTQFKYDIYTDSNFGTDQSVPIWNASVSYALMKNKSLMVMLTALDILNKNIGIVKNSSDNYFEETHREVLGNYYMLSLTYNLNGNKNPNASGRSRRSHRVRM